MGSANKLTSQSDFQKIDLEELRSLASEESVPAVSRIRELASRALEWCMVKPPLEKPALAQAEH